MSNDTHATTPATVPPKVSIVTVLIGLVLIVVGSIAVVLLVGGGLVWVTGAVETWLDLPPMSMLIAVLGLSLIATVLIAQSRIVTALHDTRWGPFDLLRDLERDDDWDDDGDEPPVATRGRQR
ncbi:hypothetical protein [Paraliomyxa miuraensis]|uniref:hypothetical protein n=1 Tax=Paraliomyxa miuraensis TaxID=376150 RepID=UPI00224CD99C|nr:hypothetical protein [Paraliomyxa miuraensis]MCX4247126.1 hypothetical protein [Paraliomyxa miuraensis]